MRKLTFKERDILPFYVQPHWYKPLTIIRLFLSKEYEFVGLWEV